jgi:hypothetical protein
LLIFVNTKELGQETEAGTDGLIKLIFITEAEIGGLIQLVSICVCAHGGNKHKMKIGMACPAISSIDVQTFVADLAIA